MSKLYLMPPTEKSNMMYVYKERSKAEDKYEWFSMRGFDAPIIEAATKPDPNDTEVSWVVYYTIKGTEFSEPCKTREIARLEKKYLQEHGLYLGNVENIYIQREEVWVVDKKKVS